MNASPALLALDTSEARESVYRESVSAEVSEEEVEVELETTERLPSVHEESLLLAVRLVADDDVNEDEVADERELLDAADEIDAAGFAEALLPFLCSTIDAVENESMELLIAVEPDLSLLIDDFVDWALRAAALLLGLVAVVFLFLFALSNVLSRAGRIGARAALDLFSVLMRPPLC